MRLAKVVVSQIQRNSSFKGSQLFVECVCQARESSAVHSQRVILFFNVGCCDAFRVWHSVHDDLFNLHNFTRAIPSRRFFVQVTEGVGFYHLPVIDFGTKAAFNGIRIRRQRVRTQLHAIR